MSHFLLSSVWLNQVCWGEVDYQAHWSIIFCSAHCAANHHSLKRHRYNTFIKTPLMRGSISSGGCEHSRAARVKWHDDMEVIWSWVWCNLIGLSLHIKQRGYRWRNDDVFTGTGTKRSGEEGVKEMDIEKVREVRAWGKVRRKEWWEEQVCGQVWKWSKMWGVGGRVKRGWEGQKQRKKREKYLPWPCALLGKWQIRASNTNGAHKYQLICPVDNILKTSSLDLQREKKIEKK